MVENIPSLYPMLSLEFTSTYHGRSFFVKYVRCASVCAVHPSGTPQVLDVCQSFKVGMQIAVQVMILAARLQLRASGMA